MKVIWKVEPHWNEAQIFKIYISSLQNSTNCTNRNSVRLNIATLINTDTSWLEYCVQQDTHHIQQLNKNKKRCQIDIIEVNKTAAIINKKSEKENKTIRK